MTIMPQLFKLCICVGLIMFVDFLLKVSEPLFKRTRNTQRGKDFKFPRYSMHLKRSSSNKCKSPRLWRGLQITESPSSITPSFFAVGKEDRHTRMWIEYDSVHYYLILKFIKLLKNPHAFHMVDVGGNHGFYSLYASQLGLRVHYFEPQIELFDRACAAMQLNGFQEIQMNLAGVGSYSGAFRVVGEEGGAYLSKCIHDIGSTQDCINVTTLDEYFSNGINNIAFLKIDNEGWEILALLGGNRLLNGKTTEGRAKVGSLLIEIAPSRWKSRSNVGLNEGTNVLVSLVTIGYETHLITHSNLHCPHNFTTKLLEERSQSQGPCSSIGEAGKCLIDSKITRVHSWEINNLVKEMVASETSTPGISCNLWLVHSTWL